MGGEQVQDYHKKLAGKAIEDVGTMDRQRLSAIGEPAIRQIIGIAGSNTDMLLILAGISLRERNTALFKEACEAVQKARQTE